VCVRVMLPSASLLPSLPHSLPPLAATAIITPADATTLNPEDEALVIVGTLGLKVRREGGREEEEEKRE